MLYASRVEQLQSSQTIHIAQLARKMKMDGIDVIGLVVGEPDFPTTSHVKRAAIEAVSNDNNGYTGIGGISGLKEAIIAKFKRENGLTYENDQICIGCGGKEVIFNAMFATLNPSDEVLIPAPYYVSYPSFVELCGANAKIIYPDPKTLKITAHILEKSITQNSKWFILNSPSNPSGLVYTREELGELANIIRQHSNLHILSDDLYEHLRFDDEPFYNMAMIAEDLKDQILVVNGFSKSYAMTGWRVGYGAGSSDLIRHMTACQTHTTYHTSVISQHAALAALSGSQDSVEELRQKILVRRNLVLEHFSGIPLLEVIKPKGAFYVYISCNAAIGKICRSGIAIQSDVVFCEEMLKEVHVAVVPGTAFGYSPYFRISLTIAEEFLIEAINRIRIFCEHIK